MSRLPITILFALGAMLACTREPAAEEPKPNAEGNGAAADPSAGKPAAESTFQVSIVPGEAKAGQPATSVIEVRPGPGFKINLEFPSRMKLLTTEGLTTDKPVLKKDDAELSEAVLRFNVPFTPASAGKLPLSGSTDFSVCNKTTCKLFRDEKLSWEVDVQ